MKNISKKIYNKLSKNLEKVYEEIIMDMKKQYNLSDKVVAELLADLTKKDKK